MRGQRIRCPNTSCREIFEVKEEIEPADSVADSTRPDAPAPLPGPGSGSDEYTLGDVIPLLPAERVERPDSPHPGKRAERKEAPADVWPSSVEDRPRRTSPRPPPSYTPGPVEESGPREILDWRQEAPPPRAPGQRRSGTSGNSAGMPATLMTQTDYPFSGETFNEGQDSFARNSEGVLETDGEAAQSESGAVATVEEPIEPHRRRKMPLIIAVLCTLTFAVLGAGGYLVWNIYRFNEEDRFEKAKELFNKSNWKGAKEEFQKLLVDFKESEHNQDYQFYLDLSSLHDSLSGVRSESAKQSVDQVANFMADYGTNPLLGEDQKRALSKELVEVLSNFAKDAQQAAKPESLGEIALVEDVLFKKDLARRILLTADQRADLTKSFEDVRVAVAKVQQRDQALDDLRQLVAKPSIGSIKEANRLIRRQPADFAKLEEVSTLLGQLFEGHRQQIVYSAGDPASGNNPLINQEEEPGLIMDPLLVRAEEAATTEERVFPALARGVLYALGQQTGKVRWARRVGIDVTTLPLRMPAAGGKPERLLLPATDSSVLMALDIRDGTLLWQARLSSPIQGKPVIVGPNAYVATADGHVFEVNHFDGQTLGSFQLGQRLTQPGTRLEDTNLVFFPAEDYCVYVLDIASHSLHTLLYTEHAAGSLLGQVITLRTDKQHEAATDPSGFLIVPLALGLDAVQLRTYSLPLTSPTAQPQVEPRLRGWPWFPAHQDAEKLVQVTDAGQLGLFGIPQPFNADPPLFPLVANGVFDLASLRGAAAGSLGSEPGRGRAQVAYAQERYFWTLAQGQLDCFRLTLQRDIGPRVVPGWTESRTVGTPLHATQVDEAGSTLFVVTQSPGGRTCLATAVEADTGRIKWQRQLGFIGQGGLMPLAGRLLGLDQGGGLCELDSAKIPPQQDLAWQTLANNWLIRPDLAHVPRKAHLVSAGEGSALVIYSTIKGDDLVVRRYRAGAEGKPGTIEEFPVNWMERKGVSLAGAPAVRGDMVLVPLDDGVLLRLSLAGDKVAMQEGPTWRASNASPTARAFVAWISDEEFVTSNGSAGLTRWRWPVGAAGYTAVPPEGEANNASLTLEAPLAAAPLALNLATTQNKDALALCLADENGKVMLYQTQPDGFVLLRTWTLGAKITAGPFLRGSSIGCVVDQNVLVWLDPTSNKPLWTYATSRAPLIGEPQVVDNSLLVADQTGMIQALDPKTGKPRNAGYRIKTIAGPAASPAPFGSGRALVPLTDGTLFLLPLERLGQAPAKDSGNLR
ncbi:MAG: PQQ-binding-like beta-propeller repeat protein [Gemmataceae bacterium]